MRFKFRQGGAVAALAGLMTLGAWDQAAAQNVQNFKPAVGTWNYFSVEGARTARHLELVPSLVLSYARDPLTVRDRDGNIVTRLVEHLGAANLSLAFGLGDRFELALDMPVGYIAGDEDLAAGVSFGSDGFAAGDLRFIPKVRLYGLDPITSKNQGFGLAFSVPVEFPTGANDRYFGEGQVTLNPKLIFEAREGIISFAANAGVKVRPDKKTVGTLDMGTEVSYGAAFGFELGTPDIVLMAEAFGAAPLQSLQANSKSSPLEALGGLRFFITPGAVITVGAGAGIIADYGSPVWRGLLGFAWHDRCYDTDGDGICDEDDKCPKEYGILELQGCPAVDTDGDGIPDHLDQCPNDPEDFDGFEDEDGCPDPDNDGDGILDVDDACPNEPGIPELKGCPPKDTDGDGIYDHLDACPTEPGIPELKGCPPKDTDGDGIFDHLDKCPTEPGIPELEGCPPKLVKITAEKIEIMEKVFFDTNKATIKPVSYEILNQVAQVLEGSPNIRVRVEGHTDSSGNRNKNKKLSQDRANSVKKYLVGKGIAEDRMEAVGYGQEQPVDDNRTKDGRENNRRVEFNIIGQ